MIRRCNITGKTEDLFEFNFTSEDYGYFANKLNDRVFSFYLHRDEFEKFLCLGTPYIIGTEEAFDNNAYKYGRYFSSESVYNYINTFTYVPFNWYKQDYPFLEYEEEQWLWEDKSRTVNDLIKQMPESDRKQAITEVMHYYYM